MLNSHKGQKKGKKQQLESSGPITSIVSTSKNDYGIRLEYQAISGVVENIFYHKYTRRGAKKVRGLLLVTNSSFK